MSVLRAFSPDENADARCQIRELVDLAASNLFPRLARGADEVNDHPGLYHAVHGEHETAIVAGV